MIESQSAMTVGQHGETPWIVVLLVLYLSFATWIPTARGGTGNRSERYSTAQLIEGFRLTVFGREGPQSPDGRQYVNKFIDPIGVYVANTGAEPDRSAEVSQFVTALHRIVPSLQIGMARSRSKARLIVYLVDRKNYRSMIADVVPRGPQAIFLADNRCSAALRSRTTGVLQDAAIFVVVDEGQKAFDSCLAEELTQALGPANDSDRLTDSLYNDSNVVTEFGLFDWFILASLYDPSMIAGMTQAEASRVLPAIIAALRTREPRELPIRRRTGATR